MYGRGACMAGGMRGRGTCMVGWGGGAGMEGEMASEAGGMHPTGMHSCFMTISSGNDPRQI